MCLACRKPSLNGNILSLDPATFPQSLQEWSAPIGGVERCKATAGRYTTSIVEIPDEPDFGGLLSVRRGRPDHCSTEESYELAPSHAEHSFLLRACRLSRLPAGDGAVAGGLSGSTCFKRRQGGPTVQPGA